ncbi:hypothetical protein BJV82DRAFT_615423 [Fennellomyces sp. T-0311]|nr:hypothetical protein BJV82DRAFT_615423 [Fennellomyces sp. T-0311]
MFDTIADTVRTETAIHGRKGITPTELWEIVGKTVSTIASSINEKYANKPPLIDDAYKRCFWPIVLKDKRLEFYEDLDAIIEESSEAQPPAETTTESQPSVSTAPPGPATEPAETAVIEESEPQSVKRKAPAKAKGKGPTKKAKTPAKKPVRKAAKKTKKKTKKISYEDDDEYSSEGYEPPSDLEESTDDEECDATESEEDEKEEEQDDDEEIEKDAPQPAKKMANAEDLLQSNIKINYRRIKNIAEFSYDQVQATYGARLRVVAEEELQTEQLYIGTPPTGRSLSPNLQIVLETILQTGPHGITQAALTKLLDLDPRSAGHYVKALEQKGTIVRKPVSHQGFRTNICIHIRYSKQAATDGGMQEYNAYNVNAMGIAFSPKRLRNRMTALLIDAKDNVMYTDDILNALGFNARDKQVKKWYHRAIDDLCSRNHFRKVLGAGGTKTRTSRCIQLVNPEEAANSLRASVKTTVSTYYIDMSDEMRFKGGAGLRLKLGSGHQQQPAGQYYDTTVESQIVDVLAAAGVKGVTQKQIMFLLSFGENKAMHRILEIMSTIKQSPESLKYMCSRDFEFEGRIRRYRYYSYQAYRKLKDDVDIEVTGPPLFEFPTSKLKEVGFKAREEGVPPARGSNPGNTDKAPTTQSKLRAARENVEHESGDASYADTSSNQSGNLASIFQRKARATRRTANEETDQSESISTEPVTRKRTRRASVATQVTAEETAEPPAKKKRGHPRKQPVDITSASSQSSAQTESPTSSKPSNPSEEQTIDEAPVRKTRTPRTKQSAPAEPAVKKKRGRPPKQPLNATSASSEQQNNVNVVENQSPEGPETQTVEQTSKLPVSPVSECQAPNKQPTTTPSPQAATASRRRGNLFDYFSSSRNSPGPSSPECVQTNQTTATRSTQEDQVPTQQDADMASQEPAEASSSADNQKTAPAKVDEKKRIHRKRLDNVIGENIVRSKSGIVSARHVRRGQNAYQEQRQKILLAMLEDKPIYERTYELKGEYIAKMKEMYPQEAVRAGLCLKTLWRTAKELEELGQAQIIDTTFTNLSGSKTTKSILVRKDLDASSPEVQQHLAYTKDKQSLRPARIQKLAKFAKLDTAVERLEERLERMEEEYSALEDKQGTGALRIQEDLKELKANIMKAAVLEQRIIQDTKPNPGNWLVIGTQFGFVNARMIRVKLLHQYIFGLLSQNIEGVDREKKIVRTTTILSWMTLSAFCQIICITDPTKELLEYTKNPESLEKRIWELPVSIRQALFLSTKKFRWHLRTYFDMLEGLGLIKAVFSNLRPTTEDDAPSTLADYYEVQTEAPLVDYRTENHDVLSNYVFTAASDLMIYWSQLQYVCTNPESPVTQAHIAHLPPERQGLVRALSTIKNWTTNHIITRELRDKLNVYVDKSAMTTPYGNIRLCKEIAEELGVSDLLVNTYFGKLERGFERKRLASDSALVGQLEGTVRKRRAPRRRTAVERNSINMTTTRVFQRTTRGSTRLRLLKANQNTEDTDNAEPAISKPFLDDEDEIPVIENSTQVESFRLRRPFRKNWKANEDELLIYCFVIMKHHAYTNNMRFLWNPATQLFPGRNIAACRNRVSKLQLIPAIAEYVHRLSALWPHLHEQGLEEGAFMDEGKDPSNYDLLARLTFFIQQLQRAESNIEASRCDLPSTVMELHAGYTVQQSLAATKKVSFEDRYHNTSSLKSKNTALVSSFLVLQSSETTKLDTLVPETVNEVNQQAISVELLQVFFKMTLLTPIEVYDPFFAYAVINKQPPSAVNLAISIMRKNGMVVKAKVEREMDRRLPGTLLSISRKFLSKMAGELPQNFFLQAKDYNEFLSIHDKTMFMPILVNSGMMGCILDMVSQDKLELAVHDEDSVRRKHQIPIHRHRKTDLTIMDFDLELKTANRKPEPCGIRDQNVPLDVSPKSSKVSVLTPEQMEIEWSGYYNSQTPSLRPLLKAIMVLLQEVKEIGATLVDIKDRILETLPDTKDQEIIGCINMLRSTQPPFIHLVGFDSLRYVTTAHLGSWVICTQGLNTLIPSSSELTELARSLAGKRAQVIDPRLWITVNGDVTEMILEECLHVIFERVMERPGITERELRRLFDSLLSYAEIKDLLDILISRKAIRKITVVSTGSVKRTLFSKSRNYTKVDPDTINRTAQTSYFAKPGYYQKLVPPKPQASHS